MLRDYRIVMDNNGNLHFLTALYGDSSDLFYSLYEASSIVDVGLQLTDDDG